VARGAGRRAGRASEAPAPDWSRRILDRIELAVAAFDDQLRLVAINRSLVRWLELPTHLTRPGTSFGVFARFVTRAAIDPEAALGRWLDWARRPRAGVITAKTPDGALVEFRKSRMPGGFVLRCRAGDPAQRTARGSRREARALEALRASEERYRAVVEDQSEFICRFRPDGGLSFVNGAFCRYAGKTRATMLAEFDAFSWLAADEADRLRTLLAGLTPARPSATIEIRATPPDRGVRYEQWVDRALFDAAGRVVEYQAVGRDITDRKLAEEALRESERLKQAALEAALDCFISIDRDGRIVEFNPAAERTFGYRRCDVIGARMVDLIVPPKLRAAHARGFARYLATGRSRVLGKRLELSAVRASGEEFPVELVIVVSTAGKRVAFVAYLRDLTAQKRAEAELRASEARLAGFMTNAPVGMYVKDSAGRYVMLNPEIEKVFGRPRHEILGRTAQELFPPAEGAMIGAYDREILETGLPSVHEEHLPGLEAYAWTLVIRFPIHDAVGRITHIAGFDVDITERKATEAALQASEQRFRALTEAHPVPVVVACLDDGKVLYASPPVAALLRTSLDDFLRAGMLPFYVDPDDRARSIAKLRRDGALNGHEVRLRRGDGTEFWAALTSKLITFEGQPAMVSGITDLTERKRAEAEIARQREALYQSEKMSALGSLLAGIAHELNNPLAVVVLQAHLLEEATADANTRRRASKIRLAADSCARIVRTFLAMVRKRPPERSLIDLADVVRSSVELMSYALRTTDIEVALGLDPDLPPLWADASQISQVLVNLIVNAQQALSEAPRPRRLRIETRFDAAAALARLVLADNGPGVAADLRARIFEPFFTTKPAGLGTGIGLSVCEGIVKSHGGRIAVDEAPGGGAAFAVELPIAQLGPDGIRAAYPPIVDLDPLAILVVDDEPEFVTLLSEILVADGHRVDPAANGEKALQQLEAGSYDLILSDIRMPELDGPSFYRQLQARWPEMLDRIAFVTGDALGPAASRFLAESGVPCLEKPFTRESVFELIARVTGSARPRASAPPDPGPRSDEAPTQPSPSGTNM
jgi:PAS domain S-box-containing protein